MFSGYALQCASREIFMKFQVLENKSFFRAHPDMKTLQKGWTPLFDAAFHGSSTAAQALIDVGADINHLSQVHLNLWLSMISAVTSNIVQQLCSRQHVCEVTNVQCI